MIFGFLFDSHVQKIEHVGSDNNPISLSSIERLSLDDPSARPSSSPPPQILPTRINRFLAFDSTFAMKLSSDETVYGPTFVGFGTSLAWWAKIIGEWPEEDFEKMMEMIYAPPPLGLGFTVCVSQPFSASISPFALKSTLFVPGDFY